MDLQLRREPSTADGVFGRLELPGLATYYTAEEESHDNARNISCIPAGTYPLRRTVYHKHGYETFEVCDVPGRSRILIHPGNTEEDTQGCILLGLGRGRLKVRDEDSGELVEKLAVVASKKAFAAFMHGMNGVQEATLTITWKA